MPLPGPHGEVLTGPDAAEGVVVALVEGLMEMLQLV